MFFLRPRRFGKTLGLSMLRYYFEKFCDQNGKETNYGSLFEGLKTMKAGEAYTRHMGQYPVISLSLKSARQPDWEMAYEALLRLSSSWTITELGENTKKYSAGMTAICSGRQRYTIPGACSIMPRPLYIIQMRFPGHTGPIRRQTTSCGSWWNVQAAAPLFHGLSEKGG